jgi:DNA-nicking Smr family endonuclease
MASGTYSVEVGKKQDNEPFHAPFARLRDRVRAGGAGQPGKAGARARSAARADRDEGAEARRGPAAAPPRPPPERSDDELWAAAVAGVEPLAPGPAVVEPATPARAPDAFWHPDLDAIRALEALVSGEAPFDLSDSDEFIEGRVPGLDPAIVRRLRRGEFAVQGHIDLHGMTREEAKHAVDEYLRKARRAGKRCVLLVHGRGIHSKDQVPILKDALRSWLATARFGRHVLAFATARPVDGGGGALYVLLRRAGR